MSILHLSELWTMLAPALSPLVMTTKSEARRAFSAVRVLPMVVGLLMALALLPVAVIGYLGVRDNTGRLLTANRDALLDGLEQQLRSMLDGTAGQMGLVGEMIADGRIDPNDREGFSRFMQGAALGQTSLVAVGWLEAEGPFRRWTKGGLGEEITSRASFHFADDVWARADRERAPHWNAPIISRIMSEGLIPHSQPVVRNGRLIGVLVTVLSWEAVSRSIRTMEEGATPFVLVGRDKVIVHPMITQATLMGDRLPRLDEIGDPALAAMWNDPRPVSQMLPGRSLTHWTWVGDSYRAQQYFYRSLLGYGGEPWLIGFHRSSLATLRERWTVQVLYYGSGLLLLLSVTLAFLLGRRAVKPAGAIAQQARALERLDFDAVERPELEASRVTEVRDTSHALARAATVLKRFQTYVPRVLVRQLMAMDETASAPTDREVTVMFMDLADYTIFSDGRTAREVSTYLNGIFAEIGPIIEASGGTIDKYTGDGLMAVWGVPVANPDHAKLAWKAALSIVEHMGPIIEKQIAQDPVSCRMRLGLHTGRVVAGDLGFAGRIDYTVVGRTVNIAQRCQAALKGHCDGMPVGLGITEALRCALKLPLHGLAPLAELRGGEQAYRVLSTEGAQTSVIPSRAMIADGHSA